MECYITYCIKGFFAFDSDNELITKKLFPQNEIIERLAEIDNKQIVKEFLRTELPEIKLVDSDATYLLWLDCSNLNMPSKELSNFLRRKQGLFLSAGIDFGQSGDNFLRMNIACPQKLLKEGLKLFKVGINNLNNNSYKII